MGIREFVCMDCGVEARFVGADDSVANDNIQDLCGTCAWLRTVDDPVERARIRAQLHRRPMF